jgi:hypothetical protein
MDINSFVFKYKKIIVIAAVNVVGLLLLMLVVSLIKGAAAGSMPSPDAPVADTVEFLADPAMKLQSKKKRLDYVNKLVEVYVGSPQKQERFAQEINNLSDAEVYQLQENVFEVAKDQIVEDAIEYARLSPEQKQEFVREKVKTMSGLQNLLKGRSSGGEGGRSGQIAKNVGSGGGGPNLTQTKVNKNIPTEPAKVYAKVLDNSSPSDRAKVDTYISAVQSEVARAKEAKK